MVIHGGKNTTRKNEKTSDHCNSQPQNVITKQYEKVD